MDRFQQILYDLGKEIDVELYPDQNQICQINYHDQIHLQIIYEEAKERIMLATFICDVPPGKYREKLLKAALIQNGEYPRAGTFAYSERNNKLTLFTYTPAFELTGEKLHKKLDALIELASVWKDAVENGKPLPAPSTGSGSGEGMFGLKR